MTHNSSQTGFTLVETMVALSLIMMVLIGPVSLITRGISSSSSSKNKVIAVNLAQEGVELVRLIRENNVICDFVNGPASWSWTRDPGPPPAGPGTTMNGTFGVESDSFISIHCPNGSQTISTPKLSTSCSSPLRFDANTGTYGYSSGGPTIFSRCVEVSSPPPGRDADIPAADQMDVVSTVTWTDRGRAQSITLRERLYHWE